MRSFCRKSPVHKIPRFRGGGILGLGGGGSADYIFMGARIFLREWGVGSVVVGSAFGVPQIFAPNRTETRQNKGLGVSGLKIGAPQIQIQRPRIQRPILGPLRLTCTRLPKRPKQTCTNSRPHALFGEL